MRCCIGTKETGKKQGRIQKTRDRGGKKLHGWFYSQGQLHLCVAGCIFHPKKKWDKQDEQEKNPPPNLMASSDPPRIHLWVSPRLNDVSQQPVLHWVPSLSTTTTTTTTSSQHRTVRKQDGSIREVASSGGGGGRVCSASTTHSTNSTHLLQLA